MSTKEPPTRSAPQTDSLIEKTPFFYGWVILALGTLGMIMTSPGQTYAVSIFIDHIINGLGLSRGLVSTLYTAGTLIGSFALPMIGRRIDRYGSRLTMLIITVIFGVACLYMGFVLNAFMLLLGFTAIRMFGQGSLSLVSTNVINQWWVRRRGTILGISGVLVALIGTGGFPTFINWLIPQFGWRGAYMVLGAFLLLGMAPLAWIFVRDRPEDYGLEPDGDDPPNIFPGSPAPDIAEENWTLAEASRTPVLWVFALGLASIAMLSTGLMFHMVSIFDDSGLSQSAAAAVYIPIAITTAIVNLGSGIIIDRFPARILLALALGLQAAVLVMATVLQGVPMALLYGVILGTISGLMRTVNTTVWAMYFGRLHLGSISGLTTTILIAGSALGPMPFGIARDILGNYTTVLTVSAVLPLALGVAALFFDRPSK